MVAATSYGSRTKIPVGRGKPSLPSKIAVKHPPSCNQTKRKVYCDLQVTALIKKRPNMCVTRQKGKTALMAA
jgi:hypothetical protein